MKLSFDHLVHFLYRPPAEALEPLGDAGFHAVAGGQHEAWGTYNSLSYFGLSYIEFFAARSTEIAAKSENPLVQQLLADRPCGEGMGQIALRTSEIERWSERFREQGCQVTGPLAGSRRREDGSLIQWKMLFAKDPRRKYRMPFLIEWADTDESRLADLTRRGVVAPHPNGASEIAYVAIAAHDQADAAEAWQEWLGLKAGPDYYDEELQATCRRLSCPGGDLVFCRPEGDGPAGEALAARGERPFLIRFAGADAGRRVWLFGSRYAW
ncbi:VOC family protein [Brevibacillus composti]|uniref:VOC family protein n=1 Tax=Brevibacillus composti TaxID=2796470 RepID=A0A7T5ENT2_9BACL|nr:VOC family protein [Brevibacillus composti]QQE75983.1 VOC family protein [Brevibacillus composti]QUO43009.1 VOC family protein [Brevibacillus composti]